MAGPAPSSTPGSRDERFPLFDSMRALAAISIVVYHAGGYAPQPAIDWTTKLNVGVSVFFVLSAFLLYRPFVRSRLRGERMPFVSVYAWRRVLRIAPAYWVALLVTALVLNRRDVFGSHGLLYFGFGQVYSSQTLLGGLSVAWTLCIEVSLYAFLPLWALLMRGLGPARPGRVLAAELTGIALLVALSIAFKAAYAPGSHELAGVRLVNSLPRYLDQFALGMGLAALSAWYESRRLPRPLRVVERAPSLCWVAAGVAFWVLATQAGLPRSGFTVLTKTQDLERHGLQTAVAVLLLLPCMFGDQRRGLLRRFLAWPVLLYLGAVSYGIYLWHPLVLHQLAVWNVPATVAATLHVSRWAAVVALGVLASAAVATLSFRFVERPALAHRDTPWRLAAGTRPPSATARVAAGAAGLALVAAGLGGVGYAFLDGVLAVTGVVLIVAAVPVSGLAAELPVAARAAAVAAACAALVPLVLTPAGGRSAVAEAASPAARLAALPPRAHVVETYDGHVLRLYVNGVLRASRPVTGRVDPGTPVTEIGAFAGGAAWSGVVDDVALYERALSPGAVARHFAAGVKQGATYAATVRGTKGVVAYWRLGESGPAVRDSVGRSAGRAGPGVTRGHAGEIAGDPDRASAFDGHHSEIRIVDVPRVAKALSVEAWVVPGKAVANRTIAARVGSWFLKTDFLGHWSAGLVQGGRLLGVSTPQAARPKPVKPAAATVAQRPPATPPSGGGGGSGLALLALLAAVGLAVAAVPWRRSVRRRPVAK